MIIYKKQMYQNNRKDDNSSDKQEKDIGKAICKNKQTKHT